ncbi:MAG: U32 family peptidase [Ignavibacteriaceae bacterium]|nr:U32 family peptidase [Ignavibacteriaceae bacterium]
METKINKPELMAPAGNWTMLRAAVKNGADAVYFGIGKLNMRAKAENFTIDELSEINQFCIENNVLPFLVVNTIIRGEKISDVDVILLAAKDAGIKKIICWDFAVIEKCKELGLEFCISTQASIANVSAAKFYQSLGASRVVLARECSLEEISEIKKNIDIEVEAFIHGAMCVAVSGRCFLSHEMFGRSANEGECLQTCRREFEIYDKRMNQSYLVGEDYVLSAKDLSTIDFIDKLIEAGIDSFKIEGRKRSPEYVAKSVSVYRKAIDAYFDGTLTEDLKKYFNQELSTVYNRGFSSGFYNYDPSTNEFTGAEGNVSTIKKEYVGKVINYYTNSKIVYVELESGQVSVGDKILIMGKTSGVIELELRKIIVEENEVSSVSKGERFTTECDEKVRPRDRVFILKDISDQKSKI